MKFGVYWALFVASFKMFVRNRGALFFSLVVPLVIMLIFGVLNFGGTTQVALGVVDEANNEASAALVEVLGQTEAFEVAQGSREDELQELEEGDRDLVLVIPEGFTIPPAARLTPSWWRTPAPRSRNRRRSAACCSTRSSARCCSTPGIRTPPLVRWWSWRSCPAATSATSTSWCRAWWR